MSLVLGALVGYLIGSIPFAYIITRAKTGLDLRRLGSRNIGATNAFEVTGQRSIGRTVLALDILKGLLPVLACELFGVQDALPTLIPALILGHCYPVWLRFHGGRGLATIAGAFSIVNPAAVVIWGLTYIVAKKVSGNVHISAATASLVDLLLAWIVPTAMVATTTLALSGLQPYPTTLSITASLSLLIVISRHVEPILALRQTPTESET